MPETGLAIELLHANHDELTGAVVDAVLETLTVVPPLPAAIGRIAFFLDGGDTYNVLLDVATVLLRELERSTVAGRDAAIDALFAMAKFDVVAVAREDVEIRLADGEFFPARVLENQAMPTALFLLCREAATMLGRVGRKRAARAIAQQR